MNDETFNTSVRKFLKTVGVTSQQQLEKAVRSGIESGRLKGDETFSVRIRLETELLDKPFEVDGTINLS
ncbi:MAG: hypothetical protein EPN69_06570 [Rhodanobacter sp.]|nr:MAG: hypothetical protein EPN69_06570 [Rhodanobacter sp.]TAM39115.1 MAG: hypothetical protein EPN58_14810 [Rhodanobacter sp.]